MSKFSLKRIAGYVALVLSVLLLITGVAGIGSFFGMLDMIIQLIMKGSKSIDRYEAGYRIGAFVIWLMIMGIAFLLWQYGRKWIRREDKRV